MEAVTKKITIGAIETPQCPYPRCYSAPFRGPRSIMLKLHKRRLASLGRPPKDTCEAIGMAFRKIGNWRSATWGSRTLALNSKSCDGFKLDKWRMYCRIG
ncbi:hypothetical protein PILCRDRAFT_813258 [Piloderma croceum F 1598]|uniref:Uncharacterized protein n=1 Tax=Piloderma croceum (strain F 1598) TaxID=765440 RepID=A0A0C3BS24_PILCF|nr:hypothetical protein PILCRDRAFT_813258 [Piloderma croceum F 1598]